MIFYKQKNSIFIFSEKWNKKKSFRLKNGTREELLIGKMEQRKSSLAENGTTEELLIGKWDKRRALEWELELRKSF